MSPLRVLFFRRIYSLLSEAFLHDLVVAAAARPDVEASVTCLLRLNDERRPFDTRHLLRIPRAVGSRLSGASSATRRLWQSDAVLWPLVRRVLRRRLRHAELDVVHASFGPDGYLIAPVARALGLPLSVGFYGYDVSTLLQRAGATWRPRYHRLFDEAALLVAISSHVAGRLFELGAPEHKVRVIPLGCRVEDFPWRDRGTTWSGGAVRCLHVGRLTAKKDPVRLVRAFDAARGLLEGRRDLRLHLTIAGGGELMTATREEIEARGLEASVELLGPVSHDQVPALLDRADVYVQHCVRAPDGDEEGLGISLVEASAAGLPIVTTDHAGIRDAIVPGETALVSPEGDAQAMGANLARLAERPELWSTLGRNGRGHVVSRFALDDTTGRLVAALRSVTEDARGGELVPRPRRIDPGVAAARAARRPSSTGAGDGGHR